MAQRKVIESSRGYKGNIVSVRVDKVEVADGVFAVREVVEHVPAVCVLPMDSEGNVYLVRQYRHPIGDELLEAPAGCMEAGETPEEAALRELREETGGVGGNRPGRRRVFADGENALFRLLQSGQGRKDPGRKDDRYGTVRIPASRALIRSV